MFNKVYLGSKFVNRIYIGNQVVKYNNKVDEPPKFTNDVQSYKTTVNEPIEMHYTASDDVGIVKHEFYDGSKWMLLYPTSIGNTHYFTLTFDVVGIKQCQVRVTDTGGNITLSNIFELNVESPLPVELMYLTCGNDIYAVDKNTLQVKTKITHPNSVSNISLMNGELYICDDNNTSIVRYNNALQKQNESYAMYAHNKILLGEYNENIEPNHVYNVTEYAIQQYRIPTLDKGTTVNNNSGFKHAIQQGSAVWALLYDNHILKYNITANRILKEITNADNGDIIIVDNEYVYILPLEYGSIVKYSMDTCVEVKRGDSNTPWSYGFNMGEYLLMVNKYMTSLYLLDKNDFSIPKSKYINNKIGSVAVDVKKQLIYVGDQLGGITIIDYNKWSIVKSVNGICNGSINHITV